MQGHYLDEKKGECLSCQEIQLFCLECGDDRVCTQCLPGFILNDSGYCVCPQGMELKYSGCEMIEINDAKIEEEKKEKKKEILKKDGEDLG